MPSSAEVIESWLRSDQPAVVFDFNGTLSDDEHILFDIFSELFRAHLGWAMTAEDYRDELLGRSDREIIERAVARHGRGTEDEVTELLRLRRGVYKQKVTEHNPIGASAAQLVNLLADNQIPVGIVTGAQREDVLAVLDGSPTGELASSAAGVARPRTRVHPRLDADPRAVGAVVVAGELDRDAVFGEGRSGDQQQRASRFDAEDLGLLVIGLRRLEFLVGGKRGRVVVPHHRVQRAGEIGGQQTGKDRRRQIRLLQHDRFAVGQPGTQHLVNLSTAVEAEGLPDVGGRPVRRRTQHPRACLDMDPSHLLGEPGQARMVELEPRRGDEVASEAAPSAIDESLGFDRAQRLPQRHPADAQRVGDVDLGRQLVPWLQRAGDDQPLEPIRDACMGRQL